LSFKLELLAFGAALRISDRVEPFLGVLTRENGARHAYHKIRRTKVGQGRQETGIWSLKSIHNDVVGIPRAAWVSTPIEEMIDYT
jgi:hypothetical protein